MKKNGSDKNHCHSFFSTTNKKYKRKASGLTLNTSNGDNDNGDNKTIKSKSFTENKHKNHTDKDLILLTTSANTYEL